MAGACAGWRAPVRRALCAALALALVAPMLIWGGLGDGAGLVAYGARWEMNDALFMAIAWLGARAAALAGSPLGAQEAHLLAKCLTGVALAALACAGGWSVWRRRQLGVAELDQRRHLAAWWCAVAAALFLLSPVQFPWYYAWLLPGSCWFQTGATPAHRHAAVSHQVLLTPGGRPTSSTTAWSGSSMRQSGLLLDGDPPPLRAPGPETDFDEYARIHFGTRQSKFEAIWRTDTPRPCTNLRTEPAKPLLYNPCDVTAPLA